MLYLLICYREICHGRSCRAASREEEAAIKAEEDARYKQSLDHFAEIFSGYLNEAINDQQYHYSRMGDKHRLIGKDFFNYALKNFDREETPVQINEGPVETIKVNVNDISTELVKRGLVDHENAQKIQNRMRVAHSCSGLYHNLKCRDILSDFYNLPENQRTRANFWNKFIQRKSVLLKGRRTGQEVEFNIKQVTGEMKKRLTKTTYDCPNARQWWHCSLQFKLIDSMSAAEIQNMNNRVAASINEKIHF